MAKQLKKAEIPHTFGSYKLEEMVSRVIVDRRTPHPDTDQFISTFRYAIWCQRNWK